MDFSSLQATVTNWHRHHFPYVDTTRIVLKAVEEIGELAKAREQRLALGHDSYEVTKLEQNAIGDILICLAALCGREGWELNRIAQDVLNEVLTRSHERVIGRGSE